MNFIKKYLCFLILCVLTLGFTVFGLLTLGTAETVANTAWVSTPYLKADGKTTQPDWAIVKIKNKPENSGTAKPNELVKRFLVSVSSLAGEPEAKITVDRSASTSFTDFNSSSWSAWDTLTVKSGAAGFQDITLDKEKNIQISSYQYMRFSAPKGVVINQILLYDNNGDFVEVEFVKSMESDMPDYYTWGPNESTAKYAFDNQKDFMGKEIDNNVLYGDIYALMNAKKFSWKTATQPLALIIMSVGSYIFGFSTFGMNIIPFICNVILVFLLYFFVKKITKKSSFALISSALLILLSLCTGLYKIGAPGLISACLMFAAIFMFYNYYFAAKEGRPASGPLVLSGVFYSLAAAISLEYLFFIIPFAAILIYSLIKNKNKENLLPNIVAFVVGYVLLFVTVLISGFVIAFTTYASSFGTDNIFEMITREFSSNSVALSHPFFGYKYADAFGLLLGFSGKLIMALSLFCLAGLIFIGYFIKTASGAENEAFKNKLKLFNEKVYFIAIFAGFAFINLFFLTNLIFINFLVCACLLLILFAVFNQLLTSIKTKELGKVGAVTVTVSTAVIAAMLFVIFVNFLLILIV